MITWGRSQLDQSASWSRSQNRYRYKYFGSFERNLHFAGRRALRRHQESRRSPALHSLLSKADKSAFLCSVPVIRLGMTCFVSQLDRNGLPSPNPHGGE